MKKISLFVLFFMVSLPIFVLASEFKSLHWDPAMPSSDGTPVEGYRVYEGIEPGVFSLYWEGNEITCSLVDLEEDITHYFVVTSYNVHGESGYSNVATYFSTSLPPKVEDVTGFNDGVNAIVNWTASSMPCRIYYGLFTGQYIASEDLALGVSFYELPAWIVGYDAYVKVVAIDEHGRESMQYDEIAINPLAIPAEVQGVSAVDDGNAINVSWNLSTEYVDNYKVYWSFFQGMYPMDPVVVNNITNSIAFTRYGMTMYVKVVGYNNRGESLTWQEITVEPYTTPHQINGTHVGKNSSGELYASWDPASDAIDGYRVYWSFWETSFNMAPIGLDDLSNMTLLPSYLYNYTAPIFVYVVGFNNLGESEQKIIISITPNDLALDP